MRQRRLRRNNVEKFDYKNVQANECNSFKIDEGVLWHQVLCLLLTIPMRFCMQFSISTERGNKRIVVNLPYKICMLWAILLFNFPEYECGATRLALPCLAVAWLSVYCANSKVQLCTGTHCKQRVMDIFGVINK